MTREEAIDVLKSNYPSSCFEDLCEAVDIAIKALSALCKDTPRKPIRDTEPRWGMGYDYYDWFCPSCKGFLTFEPNWRKIPKRCPECGQLLAELTPEEVSRS